MNKCSKISIGTAQFGMSYGLLNRYGQVACNEAYKILTTAYQNGIRAIDTSGDYGTSEILLGQLFARNSDLKFEVYSKNASDNILNSYNDTISKIGRLDGYFLHYFRSFKECPQIWDEMLLLRDSGKVKKIGFSLYTQDELEYLLAKNVDFNVVQLPFSIFDKRFLPYFELLEKKGIQIQVRSVFLQGLFFKASKMLPEKLQPLGKYLDSLKEYCRTSQSDVESLALNYALSVPNISKVVLGVHSHEQLQRNINVLKDNLSQPALDFIASIDVKELELLNPSNWKS